MIYLSYKVTNISLLNNYQKMEVLMKKYSLVVREMLTDGIMGLVFIICGILGIFKPISLFSVIIVTTVFIAEVAAIIFRFKNKFDIWDETAKSHYAEARRITLNILVISLHVVIILGLLFKTNISMNAFHIMTICGFIQLLLFTAFAVLEKRDM